MKTVNSIPFITIAILLMVNSGCNKEKPTQNQRNTSQPPPPLTTTNNSAPISNAGNDKYVFSPANFCILNGASQDRENNIQTILWRKISGPSSFHIEHPDSLTTTVNNLEIGIYRFELSITDSGGLTGRDATSVIVAQAGANEVILENLDWGTEGVTGNTLLWGSIIIIPNVYQLLPAGITSFRTFIKKDNSTAWEELTSGNNNSWYEIGLVNGDFYIWSTYDETKNADIKLVY